MTNAKPIADDEPALPIATGQEQPFFSAVLVPHRSLGRRGILLLMAAVAVLSAITSLAFWRIGAWPVVGFVGLDAVLIWLAFRLNMKAARAFEEVAVSVTEIVVRKVSAVGRAQEIRLNPVWARLEIERIEDEGVTRIRLLSRGRAVDVGAFLNPVDRTTFAEALRLALSTARAGGPTAQTV